MKQVRDSDFDKQLHERLELAEQDKRNAVELAQAKVSSELQKAAAARDTEIQKLKARLESGEVAQKLAVAEALSVVEKERDTLLHDLETARREQEAASKLAEAKLNAELHKAASTKDAEIERLKARLDAGELSQKIAVTEAVLVVEKDRDELKNGLDRVALEKQLAETALKDKYETRLKDREEAIERLRDIKAKLSTKMIGETLEQHCATEFDRIALLLFRALTVRKIMTPAMVARAILSSVIWKKQAPKSFRSYSR